MKASDQLELAGDFIEQYGFCKNHLAKNARGVPVFPWSAEAAGFCMRGALMRACATWTAEQSLWPFVSQALGLRKSRALLATISTVVAWNNAPERTRSEVSGALWRAAEVARAEGM
jgi:hypothetical protein